MEEHKPTEFRTEPGTTGRHPLYPPLPQGYSHPSQVILSTPALEPINMVQIGGNAGSSQTNVGKASGKPGAQKTNVGQATGKAGAYGGSELGSLIGGKVIPVPIVGGIIGNLVGEAVGEKVVKDTGVGDKVTEYGDKLAGVIGKRNVNKLGDMTMTAFGYGDQEVCVCCPCLPASQVLLFTTVPFYFFNWYKLVVGASYEASCSITSPSSNYSYNLTDNVTDIFPCEFGFHYLVASSAVWVVFLPFWITALFGNCWRQCCCCCCDPIVLCGTIIDFIKRCCCECGRFNCCEFIWYSQCLFHLIWSAAGLVWLVGLPVSINPY